MFSEWTMRSLHWIGKIMEAVVKMVSFMMSASLTQPTCSEAVTEELRATILSSFEGPMVCAHVVVCVPVRSLCLFACLCVSVRVLVCVCLCVLCACLRACAFPCV